MSEPGTTITCREVVELLTDYLEDTLDDPIRAAVKAHLALCLGCHEYLRQMRTTIDALGNLPPERLSDAATADLRAAFRRRPL